MSWLVLWVSLLVNLDTVLNSLVRYLNSYLHVSIYLSICLQSLYLLFYFYVNLKIVLIPLVSFLSIYLYTFLSIYLSSYLSIQLSTYLNIIHCFCKSVQFIDRSRSTSTKFLLEYFSILVFFS